MDRELFELYSWQATSSADFHHSLDPPIVSSPQQNFIFNDGKLFAAQRLKLCKYLFPAQELLSEFCDLGGFMTSSKHKSRRFEEGENTNLVEHSLNSIDMLELQKRKANLMNMLEEVHRRYKRYCEQMTAMALSFEAVAGGGAATVYISLASKAMSRHFRSLKDGIVAQMQATRKAIAERDPIAAGRIGRSETPRLKLIDQYCCRQQKSFQTGSIFVDQQPWRPQRGLPDRSIAVLRAWLFDHFLHPYPSDVDKHILARQSRLSRNQVTNWFINARVRLWKPMIEEIYREEKKEELNQSLQSLKEPVQPLIEPDSLSYIINHTNQKSFHKHQNQCFENFDFSSYSNNGVSLTLGLQQHKANHQKFNMMD